MRAIVGRRPNRVIERTVAEAVREEENSERMMVMAIISEWEVQQEHKQCYLRENEVRSGK